MDAAHGGGGVKLFFRDVRAVHCWWRLTVSNQILNKPLIVPNEHEIPTLRRLGEDRWGGVYQHQRQYGQSRRRYSWSLVRSYSCTCCSQSPYRSCYFAYQLGIWSTNNDIAAQCTCTAKIVVRHTHRHDCIWKQQHATLTVRLEV